MYIIFMQNAFNVGTPFDKMVGYYIEVSESFLTDNEDRFDDVISDIEDKVLDGTGGPDTIPGLNVQGSLGWESYEFDSQAELRSKFEEFLDKAKLSHHTIRKYEYDCV